MATARLIEKWRSRFRKNKGNNYKVATTCTIGSTGKKNSTTRPPDGLRTEKNKNIDIVVYVKDKEEGEIHIMSKVLRNVHSSDVGEVSTADVAIVRRILLRHPQLTTSLVTDGLIDEFKVESLSVQAFGPCAAREHPSLSEHLEGLERYIEKNYKKDARVWRYKSSARKSQSCEQPQQCADRPVRTTQSDSDNQRENVIMEEEMPENENRIPEDCEATPPYQVDYPLTPIVSAGNINIAVSENTWVEQPKYVEPKYSNNGYVSDGQEECYSDYEADEAEYEKRVFGMYGQSYPDLAVQNENRRSRDDLPNHGNTPPATDVLESRLNALRERTGHCDLNNGFKRSCTSPVLTRRLRRSASDHQVVVNNSNIHHVVSQHLSVDDMVISDHQLPVLPEHETSPERRQHHWVQDSPRTVTRRSQHLPMFYISDEEENTFEYIP